MAKKLILASASPRRLDLLKQAGITPDKVVPADIDESHLKNEIPSVYAPRIAAAKARVIGAEYADDFILSADTVVGVGRRILPKTETEDEARKCLEMMSGRRHRVLTAVSLIAPGGKQKTKTVTSVVQFKKLSVAEIDFYIGTKEWQGKAGGYAIQGHAAAMISFISGSYTAIVGLPLFETLQLLKGMGYERR